MKVRSEPRFTKCGTCERIRSALEDALLRNLPTDAIKAEQVRHLEFVSVGRREYLRKVELAILRPAKYLSAVVDGADQHSFALPHFVTKTKEQRGTAMKVHLIGALNYAASKVLRLYTMTDEHSTGSNHIVETVHRLISDCLLRGSLPPHFFLQLDNCVRENKNKYLMAYLDALVQWGVFESIEVGFLPVGHTHCDIDQCFSTTSDRLTFHDALTIDDLHDQVRKCYNDNTQVERMTKVANWSQLCDEVKCINNIVLITQYRFFRITMADTSSNDDNETPKTICHVRNVCTEEWRLLESDSGAGVKSFLKFLPDLSSTPPEQCTAPDDEHDVSLRIESERSRMDRHRRASMLQLKQSVYQNRRIAFHWDQSNSPEFYVGKIPRPTSNNISASDEAGGSSIAEDGNISSRMDYEYDVGSMVAVNTGKENLSDSFWIGKITELYKRNDGTVHRIRVLWFEFYNMVDSNIFNACLLYTSPSPRDA